MWVLMMRTLVTRSSERVHNSFVRVPAVDAALVPVLLLTLGLTFSPARAGAQTVSQAFVNLFSGARLYPLVDAFLWIKTPGESDGTCSGGPAAGKWWGEYALGSCRGAWDRLLGRK